MELIYTDKDYKEVNYLKNCEIDMELGSAMFSNARNDFTITMALDKLPEELRNGSLIYEEGTEFGGIVNGIGADTALNKATVYATLWRGMLAKKIIEPVRGQAYYQARGDANEVIQELIDQEFNGLIVAEKVKSGIDVYRDFRYTNLLESIEKMLYEKNARIAIRTERYDGIIRALVATVPIFDYSNEIELNNDYGITLSAKKIKSGINHVICLGKGELVERDVIHLYKLANGEITTDGEYSIKGLNEYTSIYDNANAETEDDLIEGGKKKFDEMSDEESLSIAITADVEIGDVVSARERTTGIYMRKPVTQKIAKGYIDRVKIDYKVGE